MRSKDQPNPFYCADRLELDENEKCTEQCVSCKPKQTIEAIAKKYRQSTPNRMYGDELGFLAGYNHAQTEIEELTENLKIADNVIEQLVENNSKLKQEIEELKMDKEELLECLKYISKEFNLLKAEVRDYKNLKIRVLGDRLMNGDISQDYYNLKVQSLDFETLQDTETYKRVEQLITKNNG